MARLRGDLRTVQKPLGENTIMQEKDASYESSTSHQSSSNTVSYHI